MIARLGRLRWEGLALIPIALVLNSPVVALAGLVAWWFVPAAFRRHRERAELALVESDLIAVVDQLSQQVRSGSTLGASFLAAVSERPRAHRELRSVTAGVAAGRRLTDALDELPRPRAHPGESVRLLAASLAILSKSGGPVAPALERLAETLRARRAATAEATTQASQAVASAALLAALPVMFVVFLSIVEPAARSFYLTDVGGGLCAAAMLLCLIAGWFWTERAIWGGGRRPKPEQQMTTLASVTDLVAVAVGSGGGAAEALRAVAERGPAPERDSVRALLGRWRAGVGLTRVLAELPDSLGEPYRPLAMALVSAERDGAPLGAVLARLGDEARHTRRQLAEMRARRLSVHLLLPLVCCSLPGVVVGGVVPLVVVSLRRL